MTTIPSFSKGGLGRSGGRTAAMTLPTGGRERLWVPLAIVAAAIIGLAGWMLLVSPLRDDASGVNAQTTTVGQQVDQLRSQLAKLEADQPNLPKYRAELEADQAALPTTAAMPAFLRTLQDLGTATGTSVTGLNATAPDGTTVAAGTSRVGKVYQVPVSVTVTGQYAGLVAFVADLQDKQPRAVLVSSVNVTGASASDITLTIAMTAFVAPTAGAHGG